MGAALVCDVAAVTAPGAAGAPAVAGAGSTFTIRNSALTSNVWLFDAWRKGVTAGFYRIASPKVVPVAGGINVNCAAGLADFTMYGQPFQALTPQDILAITISGGGSGETDIMVMQSYYENLPGVSMTLKNSGDIIGQAQFVFGWRVAVTTSATPGAQAQTPITTTQDSSTANAWYALLGYVTDTSLGLIGLNGVDTSATTAGGPGDATTPKNTSSYFQDLANVSGMPCIPCFNAANKANTFVVTANDVASVAANVSLVVAEMPGNWTP